MRLAGETSKHPLQADSRRCQDGHPCNSHGCGVEPA
ncbi:MAG: hypothetical protein JWM63_834 [Gammaproteobacteria bacterium]|jgi:hypothetical protein|nr:hypothetical protein [Gammaproteobacteria bacterium]